MGVLRTPFVHHLSDIGPVIVGHRGAPSLAGLAGENTPASFSAAASSGAGWVELDVRRSADGMLVVRHDPLMPDGSALVDLPAAALAAQGVWSLTDVLAKLPDGLGVDVEVKNFPGEPDYDETHVVVDLLGAVLRPVIGRRPLMATSFNPMTVQRLGETLGTVPTGFLHGPGLRVDAAAEFACELGAVVLCSHAEARGLDTETIGAVREAGLAVMVWVVDDPVEAVLLAAAGVDALCTNEPRRLVEALGLGGGRAAP